MWRLCLMTLVWADCRKYFYNAAESVECIQQVGEGLVLHPCPANYTCPSTSLAKLEAAVCTPTQPSRLSACRQYQELGQACDRNNPCGWRLYCSDGTCQKVKKWGQRCSQLGECREDTVCNKDHCELLFELDVGDEADTRLACSSGRIDKGVCQQPSLTIGSLPLACREDEDCISSARELGACVCAANEQGQAYCALHESDPPMLAFLAAMRNERLEEASALMHFALYYPVIAGSDPRWSSVVQELARNVSATEEWSRCAAVLLSCALLWTYS